MMAEPGLPGGVNPLDFLHKLATQRGLTRPEFLQLGEQGLPHNKLFMWQCSFHNVVAQATGRSKKEAKVAAARAVRDQLNFEELPPAPTHQSVLEKKKRKFETDGGDKDNGNGNGTEKKEETIKKVEIAPEDALPLDKCLRALAELRHSRWFASRVSGLPSCVECIRIMRDLARRDPVWSCLSEWAIELLVERALYSAWRPLNPAASLMRVMEIGASGILLDNEERDESFKDPCEREDSNTSPLSNLTKQEAEDITKSAQYYLRLMHFRQIYKVLGMQMEETDEVKEEQGLDGAEDTKDIDSSQVQG